MYFVFRLAAISALLAGGLNANIIALSASASPLYNPDFAVNLGLPITPNTDIWVEQLGFYYSAGKTGIETVALWDTSNQVTPIALVSFTGDGNGPDRYIFAPIPELKLNSGHQYMLAEFAADGHWFYSETAPTAAPQISLGITKYLYSSSVGFPDPNSDSSGLSYFGPNMQFNTEPTAPTPEPAGFVLLGSGLAALAWKRRHC